MDLNEKGFIKILDYFKDIDLLINFNLPSSYELYVLNMKKIFNEYDFIY